MSAYQKPSVAESPDSGYEMSFENDQAFGHAQAQPDYNNSATDNYGHIDIGGASVVYSIENVAMMTAQLSKARTNGLFPTTEAGLNDHKATVDDYFRLLQLEQLRSAYPREEWNQQQDIIDLSVRISREIRARDKLAAEKTEKERVQNHVQNMMSGVGAEAKLYSIVQHAVTFANKNGSSDQAAALTGQNMAEMLNGIRGVVKQMSGQGTHGVSGVNIEPVLEEVFGMIEFALEGQVKDLSGNVKEMTGQITRVDGQIAELGALGRHVSAIGRQVDSLNNNVNAMGALAGSTNGNVTSLTAQVALLQTIINFLPRLVNDSLEQLVPGILEAALAPLLMALEAHAARLGVVAKKPGFFKKLSTRAKRIFKKST